VSLVKAARHIGWLLRVNRRLGPEQALRSGRSFASAFRGDGHRPLAPSQITRWESGQVPAGRDVIRSYEQLLGLSRESLATVADIVMRSAGSRMPVRGDADHNRDRLFGLLDQVTASGAMSGVDWSALTELIASRPHLELYPPRLWDDISRRLLAELGDAVGSEWLLRQEAMCRLLEHQAARRHAIVSCIELVDDPSSPAVMEPLTLLEATAEPAANRYVLRQIESPNDERTLQAALDAAIHKVSLGHLQPTESTRLASSVSALMSDLTTDDPLLPLAVEAGRRLARQPAHADRLTRRLPVTSVARQIWTAQRVCEPASARAAAARVATLAQARLADQTDQTDQPDSQDETLVGLAEEALFHSDPDRRFVATALIGATPYRIPLAHVLLDEVKADLARHGGTYPPGPALRVLTLFGVDIHRPLINYILTQPGHRPTIRHAAAWATPYCAGRNPEPTWRRIFTTQLAAWRQSPLAIGESILHAVAFGVGTDSHRGLLTTIRDHPHTPPAARMTASGMLRNHQSRAH